MQARIHLRTLLTFSMLLMSAECTAQTLMTKQVLDQQNQWVDWANTQHKLVVSVRFEGRASRNFRVYKLPLTFVPPRGSELPQRMKSGQRLNISGHLRKNRDSFDFIITRLDIQLTDREWLADRTAAIPVDELDKLYPLADEFAQIAQFFDDEDLMADVSALRLQAFTQQRTQFAKNSGQLWQLAEHARELGISPRLISTVRFQSLILQHKEQKAVEQLIRDTKQNLVGWDRPQPNVSAIQLSTFRIAPVSTYEKSDDQTRQILHRLFYRSIRQPQLSSLLKDDGSNGLTVAEQLKQELPEEIETISKCEQAFVDFKLSQMTDLSRNQLVELITLLEQYKRTADIKSSITQWLDNVEHQFADRGLQGLLRVADEYQFAWDQWKDTTHRDKSVEYLKKAWQNASEVAPQEAIPIAQRLERLGWVRLHERWMTNDQIEMLPRSDIQLAMREGRVVKGMTPEQVSSTLGSPGRIVRVVSARYVQEIWVYQTAGASGISVHLRRSRRQEPAEASVVLISQISAGPISKK